MFYYGAMVRLLHSCISQQITNELAEMNLTSSQGHIMGYLAGCQEPPCPKDVEEAFQLSHPTVSGLLSRLEKKEFISLRPDPADGRCKRIVILEKGRQCNGTMHSHMLANEGQIVAGFSEDEKRIFADLLLRAVRNMGGEPHFSKEEETSK